MTSVKKPATFQAETATADRDGEKIVVEVRCVFSRFLLEMDPRRALELAHDIERAFHQEALKSP